MTPQPSSTTTEPHALNRLPREDLDFIVQLVLLSGSLKDLAAEYGVSYPTIRARLDRVIERLKAVMDGKRPDPVNELLAELLERGEISPSAARSVREAVRKQSPNGERP